jgi:hypothetical protein
MARSKSWRPRQGIKLTVETPPGWIERTAVKHIGKLPKIFLYGPVALIVGWLLAVSGRGELKSKSIGAALLALWLAIDLWHLLLQRNWRRWRFVFGWTGTSLLIIGWMCLVYVWINGVLQDQREDVYGSLDISEHLDPGKNQNWTEFTLVNKSAFALSGRRQLVCYDNLAVGNSGTSSIRGMWLSFILDTKTGQPIRGVMGSGPQQTLWNDIPIGPRLRGGGDSETYSNCANLVGFATETDCLDMTLTLWYSLDTQRDLPQHKEFRFIGTLNSGEFEWTRRAVDLPASPCERWEKPLRQPS